MDRVLGSLPEEPAKPPSALKSILGVAFIALGVVIVLFLLVTVPGFLRAKDQGQFTHCKSNLKNLATALEMYSSDNGGRYPKRLEEVTPKYLKELPTCPAGQSAYSNYQSSQLPDAFSFSCVGNHHATVLKAYGVLSDNFPAYTSERGLIEHGQERR